MSEPIKLKKSVPNEVERVDLHDAVPFLANSKTLARETMPGGVMSFEPGSHVLRIEHKGRIVFMPITNIKAIWMKP